MSYTSFERQTGGVLERVEAICRHLTTGGSFKDTSPIPLADVERFIDDAYYWLLGTLVEAGYSTTVTAANVKAVLEQIQSLDAAAQIEFSMPGTDGEENDRFKGLVARRDRLVGSMIRTDALQQLGATRERERSKYLDLTGRSRDRKRDVYTDSDVPQARFPRGFGQRADVPDRSGVETSGGADSSQV